MSPACVPDETDCPGTPACSIPTVACDLGAEDTTTLSWWTPRTMPVDVYVGQIGPGIGTGTLLSAGPFWLLASSGGAPLASCLLSNVPPGACGIGCSGTSGPLGVATAPNPPPGFSYYYLATMNSPALSSGDVNALGCAGLAGCLGGSTPGASCTADVQCGTGICLNVNLATFASSFNGCPPNGDPHKVVRQVLPASLCP